MYEIDTTERMNHPNAFGVNLKDVLAGLRKTIDSKELSQATVGIKTFGKAQVPDDKTRCGGIETIYKLQSLNIDDAEKAVDSVNVNGYHAPLVKAVEEGLSELEQEARGNAWLDLIVLTGGPDDCPGSNQDRTLSKVSEAISNSSLRIRPLDVQLFGLTLRLASPGESEQLAHEISMAPTPDMSEGRARHLELIISDASALNEALGAISGLADLNVGRRNSACHALVNLFATQGDQRSVGIMQDYCSKERR
jgi:hypothetical protein